jgi:hypothetical protein
MSGTEEALRSNLLSRIASKIEAGKQFLVVVIGLGLTSSVAEKLKYALNSQVKVQWGSDGGGGGDGYYISAPDSAFEIVNLVTLGVFLFYALRFSSTTICIYVKHTRSVSCSVAASINW